MWRGRLRQTVDPVPLPERIRPGLLAGLSLLFGVVLLWPAFLNGGPLLFPDSLVYVDQGRQAVEGAVALIVPADGKDEGASGFQAAAASATYIRSLSWSGFAHVTALTPIGLYGPVLIQSLLVAMLILMLLWPVSGGSRIVLFTALASLTLLTSLPWFASFLMPDILAAVLVLAAMLLVQGSAPPLRRPLFLGVVALATTFAVASHYGFMPLGAAMAAAVLAVLAFQGRLAGWLVAVAVAPLLIAAGANMAASQVAFDSPDVAPKRLPIMLARSIADGPAYWYLQDNCPGAGYVLCRHLPDMPRTIGGLLWGPDSLLAKLSEAELEALRQEETAILAGAFRAYPVQQGWALAGNGVRQLVAIGTDDFYWRHAVRGPDGRYVAEPVADGGPDRTGLDVMAAVHTGVVLLSVLVLVAFAARDRLTARPDERALLFILLVGLLANAAIFGGLSAPVDRYQARIIWLVPMLAMLFAFNRYSRTTA